MHKNPTPSTGKPVLSMTAQPERGARLVENLMKTGKTIELRNVDRDKYFRILADVWVDDKSVADILIKNRVAYAYDGGRKPASMNWCKY